MIHNTDVEALGSAFHYYEKQYMGMYYEWLQLRIVRHLSVTGGQYPLKVPDIFYGRQYILFDFTEAFDNWALWLDSMLFKSSSCFF